LQLVPPPAPISAAPFIPAPIAAAVTAVLSATRPGTANAPKTERRRKYPDAYPLCWATQLLFPAFFGVPVSLLIRTPGVDRDQEDADQRRLELIYREKVDPDFHRADWHIHHSVPLFLGGMDAAPGNLVLVEKRAHLRGHGVLRHQPQMATPPPPLAPLPVDLYAHPAGTRYELTGFKTEANEPC
jgi:hypothetical protein